MKVLQTIGSLDAKSGGTSTSTCDLMRAISYITNSVDLLTIQSDQMLGQGEGWLHSVPNDYKTPYAYSLNLKSALEKSNYDIYHANGLWMHVSHITCAVARAHAKPYILTPHGMLYPNGLRRSYWKKWPMLKLFFNKDIREAACLHATCFPEMKHIRSFGYKGPIAVIPNPAFLPEYINEIRLQKKEYVRGNNSIRFGFLGRLHNIKMVENILYGLSILNTNDVELVIMGKGDDEYEKFLRSEVERLNLKNVVFRGFVSGREKYDALAQLTCLFVPSESENFGMIVTEALSVGTPVMASLGTPWEELNSRDCGWWTSQAPENIAKVMQEIIVMSKERMLEMGANGIKLVEEKYVASKVANHMIELYKWINQGGEKPSFVYE